MTERMVGAMTLSLPSDREIVMTRMFDAPRDLVWQVMNDPAQIPNWWGPAQYTTTVDKMDVRPGGAWRFVQTGAEGEFGFHGEYREIVPPERLVYTFEWEGLPGHVLVDTINLEDVNGKTKVTVTSSFDTTEDRDGMLHSGMETGAAESYDRLAAILTTLV